VHHDGSGIWGVLLQAANVVLAQAATHYHKAGMTKTAGAENVCDEFRKVPPFAGATSWKCA